MNWHMSVCIVDTQAVYFLNRTVPPSSTVDCAASHRPLQLTAQEFLEKAAASDPFSHVGADVSSHFSDPASSSPAAGVVEGDLAAIEAYKSSGGDIARQLTADEVQLLNRSSAFDEGFTLVHLAIRFQRQDMLAILLTEVRML